MEKCIRDLQSQLIEKYGVGQKNRIQRGVWQVAQIWRAEDGTLDDFKSFIINYFVGEEELKDELFKKFEKQIENLDGYNLIVELGLREPIDLNSGSIDEVDKIFAAYNPVAHLLDDFFKNKLAHIVLLNFPVTNLAERLNEGEKWTRREWAETRLASRFSKRISADIIQKMSEAFLAAEAYISEYKFCMDHVVTGNGERHFQKGLKLISHWDLRDEIRGLYSDKTDNPAHVFFKQRMIQGIMEKIVYQDVPLAIINNPHLDWNVENNTVSISPIKEEGYEEKLSIEPSIESEKNLRYAKLYNIYKSCRLEDSCFKDQSTYIERDFNEVKEMPEERVRSILTEVLTAPELRKIASLISNRVDRPLEPFDLWYSGFHPRGDYSEEYLDKICKERYPTLSAFQKDIVNILEGLDFSPEKASYIANQIIVEPARGAGHAVGAAMRYGKAHLRTNVSLDGMGYKSFNTGMHELGYCVEQTISLHWIDEYFLKGVPNTAFTEAMAFIFQGKDMRILGLSELSEEQRAYKALNDLWMTYEIAGVSMVDMNIWQWMYQHSSATPEELRDAVILISKDIWNQYYASVFEIKDSVLLGIYSHMICYGIYLPNYPLGHIIASQIEHYIERNGKIGPEIERMAKIGDITPDLWMKAATGTPVTPRPMIEAAAHALKRWD